MNLPLVIHAFLWLSPMRSPLPPNLVSVHGQAAIQRSSAPTPEAGYGFLLAFRHSFPEIFGGAVRGLLDAGFERFKDGTPVRRPLEEFDRSVLSYSSFGAGLGVGWPIGSVTPWIGWMGGVSVARFTWRDTDPKQDRELSGVLPLVRGLAGVDYELGDSFAISFRAAYSWYDSDHRMDVLGTPVKPFNNVLTLALGGGFLWR